VGWVRMGPLKPARNVSNGVSGKSRAVTCCASSRSGAQASRIS
jgi:hypothetical protein